VDLERDQFAQIPGNVHSGKSFKAFATVTTTMKVTLMSIRRSEHVSKMEALYPRQSCPDGIVKLVWLIPAPTETATLLQGEMSLPNQSGAPFPASGTFKSSRPH
jgi:hypothetical protein